VVDLPQNDGTLFRGDLPSEASSDRDPDSLLDLLLESLGRARDELRPNLVQEQDRGGVRVERLSHPDEQLVKQIFNGEVREGSVGYRLNAAELIQRRLRRDVAV
jgi:hypothetical protein